MHLLDRSLKRIFPLLAICLLGTLIYSNTFQAPFQFDDKSYIVDNLTLRNSGDIKSIWDLYPARFIGMYSFALNYYFHQLDTFGYHLINFLIHIITSVLVWWLLKLLLSTAHFKNKEIAKHKSLIAFSAAFLFLTHPIQTQAVTYITQRFSSLSALFYVLSICTYIKGRLSKGKRFYLCSAISALLGMLTKQTVLTLPLMILLVEFTFLYQDEKTKYFKNIFLPLLILILLFLTVIPSLYSFRFMDILSSQGMSHSHEGDYLTGKTYLLTQFRVMATYIRLLFLPVNQNLDYDYPMAHSLFEWPTGLSFLFHLSLLFLAIRLFSRHKIISFGIFWFYITLSVESSIIVIHHVIFEHRLYLPSIGFCLIICVGLYYLIKDPRTYVIIISILVLVFSIATFQRNNVWRSNIALWTDAAKKSPNKPRAHHSLGMAYFDIQEYDKAIERFNKTLELNPKFSEAYNSRGSAYSKKGQPLLAIEDYRKVLEINSNDGKAHYNLGIVYFRGGQIDLAIAHFTKAIESRFDNPKTYFNRGSSYMSKRQYDLALQDYSKVLELNPKFSSAHYRRSLVYRARHEYLKSMKDALKAKSMGYPISQAEILELKRLYQRL